MSRRRKPTATAATRHAAELHAAAELLGGLSAGERDDLLQRMRWAGTAPPHDPLPRCHLHPSCDQQEANP
jgi:hypothetical protein